MKIAQILILVLQLFSFIVSLVKEGREVQSNRSLVIGVLAELTVRGLILTLFYYAGAFSEIL